MNITINLNDEEAQRINKKNILKKCQQQYNAVLRLDQVIRFCLPSSIRNESMIISLHQITTCCNKIEGVMRKQLDCFLTKQFDEFVDQSYLFYRLINLIDIHEHEHSLSEPSYQNKRFRPLIDCELSNIRLNATDQLEIYKTMIQSLQCSKHSWKTTSHSDDSKYDKQSLAKHNYNNNKLNVYSNFSIRDYKPTRGRAYRKRQKNEEYIELEIIHQILGHGRKHGIRKQIKIKGTMNCTQALMKLIKNKYSIDRCWLLLRRSGVKGGKVEHIKKNIRLKNHHVFKCIVNVVPELEYMMQQRKTIQIEQSSDCSNKMLNKLIK